MGMKLFRIIGKVVTTPVTLVRKGVNKSMDAVIMGFIRHLLTSGGGALVSAGYLTGSQELDAIGAIMTLVGLGWSFAKNRKAGPVK